MKEILKKRLIIFLSIIFFCGCSNFISKKSSVTEVYGTKEYADEIVSKVIPKWFTGSKKFSLKQGMGEDSGHMFYDVSPDIDLDKFTLNFIVTTPENSEYSYDLDVLSGQLFVSDSYCSQKDIWKQYSGDIFKPPYTAGIVPRILDQTGSPQKIIVFGDKDFYTSSFTENFFDARVVGGFIEQVCPFGGCSKNDQWKSRIVLVGVQKGHPKYKSIKNLNDLKSKVDWPLVEAFVENGQGVNTIASSEYPGFRMGANISKEQAFRYINKNSVFLKSKKLLSMRRSCYRLYNHIWSKVQKDSKFESEYKKLRSLKERTDFLKANKLNKSSLFFTRFKDAFIKFNDEYSTCMKFIYPTNINYDKKRHWFFSYYSAVHFLHELGYSFDCDRNMWVRNQLISSGQKLIPLKDEFASCNARKIDRAIEQSISFLDSLRKKNYSSYRYIDYDRGSIGTHKKIYSWVYDNNKVLRCDSKDRIDFSKVRETFPKDIKWERKRIKLR